MSDSESDRSEISGNSSRDLDEWVVVNNSQHSDLESNDDGSTKVVYIKDQSAVTKNPESGETTEKIEFGDGVVRFESADQLPHCSDQQSISSEESTAASIVFVNKSGSAEENCSQVLPNEDMGNQKLYLTNMTTREYVEEIDRRRGEEDFERIKAVLMEEAELEKKGLKHLKSLDSDDSSDDSDQTDEEADQPNESNHPNIFNHLQLMRLDDVNWKLKIARLIFYIVTALFFVALAVTAWRSASDKKATQTLNAETPSHNMLRSCQSDLHDKLRQLATCKSSKDFCETADKPDCTKHDVEKMECKNRLGEMGHNIQQYKTQHLQLMNEIKLLQSNLTSMAASYSNLRAAKLLEANWFKRTNEALLEKLKTMNEELAESRKTDTTLRHLLAQLEYRLHALKEDLEKSRRGQKPHDFKPDSPEFTESMDLTDYVRKLFAHFKPYKVEDLVTFTTSILNESFFSLRKFYENVQQKSEFGEEGAEILGKQLNLTNDFQKIKSSLVKNFGEKMSELWRKSKFLPEEWHDDNNNLDFSKIYNLMNDNFGKILATFSPGQEDEEAMEESYSNDYGDHFSEQEASNDPIFPDNDEESEETYSSEQSASRNADSESKFCVPDHLNNNNEDTFDAVWGEKQASEGEKTCSSGENQPEEKSIDSEQVDLDSIWYHTEMFSVNAPSEAKLLRGALKSSDFDLIIDENEADNYLYRLKRISKLSSYDSEEYLWWECQKFWWLGISFRPIGQKTRDCSNQLLDWQAKSIDSNQNNQEKIDKSGNRRRRNGYGSHVTILTDQKKADLIRQSSYLSDVLTNMAEEMLNKPEKMGASNENLVKNEKIVEKDRQKIVSGRNFRQDGQRNSKDSASKASDWLFDRWRNRQSSRRQDQQGYDQSKWVFERGSERDDWRQHHQQKNTYKSKRVVKNKRSFWDWEW